MRCGETLGDGAGFRPRPDDSGSWWLASRSGFRSIQKIATIPRPFGVHSGQSWLRSITGAVSDPRVGAINSGILGFPL